MQKTSVYIMPRASAQTLRHARIRNGFSQIKVLKSAATSNQLSMLSTSVARLSSNRTYRPSCSIVPQANSNIEASTEETGEKDVDVQKELKKAASKTATTFAPVAKKGKNPAYKGSLLYTIFEVQAYLAVVVGGLLAFNVIYPSDEPNIARLLGMWSIW
ncbi:hypothetical protein CYMTET_53209 [Cymbomonas tetramitiformis]|uniref:Uncharacterized protein n=1 Tax=Cymbomonas tetramitiformis TaxID=36881 RepID=A0AAE0ERY7_9CHLO|nr:hypothetical protein CYMTET_53209 [Cymbomonas tetramitiformis]